MSFCRVFFKKGDLSTKNYLKNSNNIFAENLPEKKKQTYKLVTRGDVLFSASNMKCENIIMFVLSH